MYTDSQPLNGPGYFAGTDEKAGTLGVSESIIYSHADDGVQELEDGGNGFDGVEFSVSPISRDGCSGGSGVPLQFSECSNQLTLSFRGQFYVFDVVTTEKGQAVLLLLGSEIPSSAQAVGAGYHDQSERGSIGYPGKCSDPHRITSLMRFRQKRKERCFEKKIRYAVRQQVALRMLRKNGQFTSKRTDENMNWNIVEDPGQENSPTAEALCTHFGTSSNVNSHDAAMAGWSTVPLQCMWPFLGNKVCNTAGHFEGSLKEMP